MNNRKNYGKTLLACYLGFITQAISANFAPLLFLTFYRTYGISLDRLALASVPVLGLIGCTVCGFSVGIMWPGSISISSSVLPSGGTAMFALLALAGDLGGAAGPAIVGMVSQRAGENLQAGVLAGIGFPLVLVISVLVLRRWRGKERQRR